MTPKLSIIIPVYNVEQYLSKCLDSCVKQDLNSDEYEIIIVNDGSSDSSSLIIDNYLSHYDNIKLLKQENQGLSMARNNGLGLAKGEYIWFVDSDDWIVENCLNGIVKTINTFQPDIVHLNYNEIWTEPNKIIQKINHSSDTYSSIITGKLDLIQMHFPIPAQLTIYRRQFLINNKLYFTPSILHEDMEFKPRAVYLAEKVIWYEAVAYNFLKGRTGSITSIFSMKNFNGYKTVMENLHEFTNNTITDSACKKAMNRIIGLAMNTLLRGMQRLPKTDYNRAIKEIENFDAYFKDMAYSGYPKYLIEGYLLKLNANLALKIFNKVFFN